MVGSGTDLRRHHVLELRVNQSKMRVHGIRANAAFYLVLLDREHRVWPMWPEAKRLTVLQPRPDRRFG